MPVMPVLSASLPWAPHRPALLFVSLLPVFWELVGVPVSLLPVFYEPVA